MFQRGLYITIYTITYIVILTHYNNARDEQNMAELQLYEVFAVKNKNKVKYFKYVEDEAKKLRRFVGVLFVYDPTREDEFTRSQYDKLDVKEDEFVVVSYDHTLMDKVISEGGTQRMQEYMDKNYP